jgi:hypothetical protein
MRLGLQDLSEARFLNGLEDLASLGNVLIHFGIEATEREVVCFVLARDELSTQLQKRPNAFLRCDFVRSQLCSRRAIQAQPMVHIWGDLGALGEKRSKEYCPEIFHFHRSGDGGTWEGGCVRFARFRQNCRSRRKVRRREVFCVRRFCVESQGIPVYITDSPKVYLYFINSVRYTFGESVIKLQ